jgi:eukaryotic-like serine/threonine-protein kinase
MRLAAGTKLGPYQIIAFVGAGGMGEVYSARDSRLDRTVAIKILNVSEVGDPSAKERFGREARIISSLNHPNICQIYDVGEQDGLSYLVMEYLDGQTLADRLLKAALPLDQVLRVGVEICDALERAHRSGVVHRDLKPGNIMLTSTGTKLMDFGLAKSMSAAASALTETLSAAQHPLTTEGTIVGTVHYMAPEQAEGREVDGQSDVFSLGAILYEMVTGQSAFPGKTRLSVISAILEKEPRPIRSIKPATPPALVHLIDACLEKDRKDRWQTAHDVGVELLWIARGDSSTGVRAQQTRYGKVRERLSWLVAAGLSLLCLALAFGFLARSPRPMRLVRSSVLPPPGSSFLPYNFAIAPDGGKLAFVALGPEGKTALWVRALSTSSALQLTGTEGAIHPFWSPDSLHIGFFAEGRLKSVDLLNSSVQTICDSAGGFGGTWNQDGVIVFAPAIVGPIFRVAATGGAPEAVTKIPPGSGESQHWPFFLPDGKHFLYVVNWSGPANAPHNGLYVGSLDHDDSPTFVSPENDGNVLFAASHLLYVRDRTIVAQPFDTSRLRTNGPAIPLTQPEVDKFFDFWQSGFSVSQDGKLIFQSAADSLSRLVWYDPAGNELNQFPEIGYEGPQFSPDGQSVAVYADDEHNGKHFIRLYDLKRGISSRLTTGGHESNPVWSPDGRAIAFRNAQLNIAQLPLDASTPAAQLVSGANVIPCDWSRDGHLIYMSIGTGNPFPSLEVYSLLDQKSTEFATAGAEAQFSPDGKWVAYINLPTRQIVVQRFPGPGMRLPISNLTGSSQPRWSHDGRKIFFVQPDRKIMVVAFDSARNMAGAPQVFAQTRIVVTMFGWFQYAVSLDNRLLVNSLPANSSAPLTLLSGWEANLNQR